jgi:hypothetical protein
MTDQRRKGEETVANYFAFLFVLVEEFRRTDVPFFFE